MSFSGVYHVVAMARNRVIGRENKLPWHFPSDLRNFKQLTMGQTLIMGRKTFESIGRPLPGRKNFILSRGRRYEETGDLRCFSSIDAALAAGETEKGFIIGGAEVFRQTIELIDGVYLTHIHEEFEGDTYYPEPPGFFKEKSRTLLQVDPVIEFVFYENEKKKETQKAS